MNADHLVRYYDTPVLQICHTSDTLTFDGWAVGIGHIFCGQERSFSAGKPLGLESDRARHTHALCQALRRHWERVSNTLKASTWNSWVWTKLWEALIIDHTIRFSLHVSFERGGLVVRQIPHQKKKKSPPDNPMWVKHMVKHMVRHLTGSVTHEGRQGFMNRGSQWKLCVAIDNLSKDKNAN